MQCHAQDSCLLNTIFSQKCLSNVYIKKLDKKSGQWFTVSLINEKGSFRGAAKFERGQRLKSILMIISRVRNPGELKVFAE